MLCNLYQKLNCSSLANTPIFPVISFLPHFLYTIYVWLNYPLVWNMYKVCAAERYALNKQSTKKHKITMWLTKLKYWSKRTVQNITTLINKGNLFRSTRVHPPLLVGFMFLNLYLSVYFVVVDFCSPVLFIFVLPLYCYGF